MALIRRHSLKNFWDEKKLTNQQSLNFFSLATYFQIHAAVNFGIRSFTTGDFDSPCVNQYFVVIFIDLWTYSVMNLSDLDSVWSGAPDAYEVEITESHRLTDVNFNDTNNNATLTFQGKLFDLFFKFEQQLFLKYFRNRNQNHRKTGRSFNCNLCVNSLDGRHRVVRSPLGKNKKLWTLCSKVWSGGASSWLVSRSVKLNQ